MPLRSSQLVFVGLSSAAITLAVIFGAVYWMDRPTKAAANNRTTLELAKATCLAVTEQKSGKELGNFTPEQVCDCTYKVYANAPTDVQAIFLKMYELVESDAPTDQAARDLYDKTFIERAQKYFKANSNPKINPDIDIAKLQKSFEKFTEDLKTADFGPVCNQLTFGQPNR